MARKMRVEVEGGLYHVITRGNDRQDIFHSAEDYLRFLTQLCRQKERSPFFLYAYCLMTNHVHLLIERQLDSVGGTMQRLLTGYSQYYNRRYKRVGHVFQGRHKAILCQSEVYLARLVRYIHLNPVRARMVTSPGEYPYSSHRAYLGMEAEGIVDVDPVLRLFGPRRKQARERFAEFVMAKSPDDEASYACVEGDILGSEEFTDATIHRLGEIGQRRARQASAKEITFDAESLLSPVEAVFGVPRSNFCGSGKSSRAVMAKEVLILTGRQSGASITDLSQITGLDSSTVSRRCDAARQKAETDSKLSYIKDLVEKMYNQRIAESQA